MLHAVRVFIALALVASPMYAQSGKPVPPASGSLTVSATVVASVAVVVAADGTQQIVVANASGTDARELRSLETAVALTTPHAAVTAKSKERTARP